MADESLFIVKVVTPERVLFDGVATEVILRTGEGDTTFLAGHTPLVGTVEPGVVRVVGGVGAEGAPGGGGAESGEVRVAAHGGFVQVEQHVTDGPRTGTGTGAGAGAGSGTRVTLLIGVAELADEIDAERAQTALEAAEARVSELGGSASRTGTGTGTGTGDDEEPDAELVEAQAELLRAKVRLEAADTTTGGTAGTSSTGNATPSAA
jgi:F-type H+-transporting ATPase subunit epsilon